MSSHMDAGCEEKVTVAGAHCPELPASHRCTEGQTWPFVCSGRWTRTGSEKHTRCSPRTLTSLGGGA